MRTHGCSENLIDAAYCMCISQVDEKPMEEYSDIGGLDKQIQELIEVRSISLSGVAIACCFSSYDTISTQF